MMTQTAGSAIQHEQWRMEKYGQLLSDIINKTGVSEIIDYGCGNVSISQYLRVEHPISVALHDRDVLKYSDPPLPRPLVSCVNALHGDMELSGAVAMLDGIKALAQGAALIAVRAGLIKNSWWVQEIVKRFDLHAFTNEGDEFWCIVKAA